MTTDPAARARAIAKRFGVNSIPVPVDRIARQLGAQLRVAPLDEEISGMIYINDDIPIIGVNALHHPNRQRFTIAHELGHLELHRELLTKTVHVDKQYRVLMRDQNSSTGTDSMEIQANAFAAELLMPANIFERLISNKTFDIDDEGPLIELAKKFKVSKQAVEFRIRNLV
jgi:Zn-dependent peptidase ImmA (M78 family)